MSQEFLDKLIVEYYKILEIVNEFDKRFMTVKGWGVTLSLAALTWGFKDKNHWIFLVASISALSFWLIEAQMKRHQMRYYIRMREIEYIGAKMLKIHLPDGSEASTPQLDWSWSKAPDFLKAVKRQGKERNNECLWALPSPQRRHRIHSYSILLFPHVFLPHLITLIAGAVLFSLVKLSIIKW